MALPRRYVGPKATPPNIGSKLLVLDTERLEEGWSELPSLPGTPRCGLSLSAVGGKLFVSLGEESVTVKSTPDRQAVLVQDPAISVAAYVGRFGWVSVELNEETVDMALSLIDDSYEEVFAGLPKRVRDKITG